MYALKQPMTMHTIPIVRADGTRNGRKFKRINEVTAFPDYIVCCEEEDNLINKIKEHIAL